MTTTTTTYEASFVVSGIDREGLSHASGLLMDELLELEAAGCGIHSSAVSVDLGKSVVTVEVDVDGDLRAGEAVANSCIRAAIHATGGGTPDWLVPSQDVSAEPLASCL